MGIENRDYYRDSPVYRDGGGGGMGWNAGSLTPVVKWLLIVTAVVFVGQLFTPPTGPPDNPYGRVQGWLQMDGEKVLYQGQVWRLVTVAFCHSLKSPLHIIFNMIILFFFGPTLERKYGGREFLLFYLTSAAMASFAHIGLDFARPASVPAIGASGAIMGVMMLYAANYPRQQIMLFFVIRMEIRRLVLFLVILDMVPVLFELAGRPLEDNIGHAAHLGGLAFGFVYWKWNLRLEKFWLVLGALRFDRLFGSRRRIRLHEPSREGKQKSMEAKVDRLLEKVHREGEESLTPRERQVLMKASEQYKNRRRASGDE